MGPVLARSTSQVCLRFETNYELAVDLALYYGHRIHPLPKESASTQPDFVPLTENHREVSPGFRFS